MTKFNTAKSPTYVHVHTTHASQVFFFSITVRIHTYICMYISMRNFSGHEIEDYAKKELCAELVIIGCTV